MTFTLFTLYHHANNEDAQSCAYYLSKAPGNCASNQTQFQCKSTACVPLAVVCDFTDDCGDGSDEASCGESF